LEKILGIGLSTSGRIEYPLPSVLRLNSRLLLLLLLLLQLLLLLWGDLILRLVGIILGWRGCARAEFTGKDIHHASTQSDQTNQ